MEYSTEPNLLLEAIAYLGRKATGNTWERMDEKISERDYQMSSSFQSVFTKIKELTALIDFRTINMSPEQIQLFNNLEGFQFNTIGTFSSASLLYLPMAEQFNEIFHGDFEALVAHMKEMSPHVVSYNLLEALGLSDSCKTPGHVSDRELMDTILSLLIPDSSKISLLSLCGNYKTLTRQAADCIRPVLQVLEENPKLIADITTETEQTISAIGCDEYFRQSAHFNPKPEVICKVHPFIFGMDTNISFSPEKNNPQTIYCGILRREMSSMINQNSTLPDEIYDCFRLLGDRTRFDILCRLQKQSSYGQELSDYFGLSRNTIHHHMNKLANQGLVTCRIDGNKVYYSLNKEKMADFLKRQKQLFLSESAN